MKKRVMKRRQLLAGMALAGVGSTPSQAETGSLYIPSAHLVEDRNLLHEFMDEFSFVELITTTPEIRVTHIPVLLDRTAGKFGTLYGHIARLNPQHAAFDGRHPAVIVFSGPHSYISPTWYAKSEAVPTWNFAAVHASGKPKAITDKTSLYGLLDKLVKKFENAGGYDLRNLPDSYKSRMMNAIIGFDMEIELLEGKFKLGQERSDADKQGILRNLQSARSERSLYEVTEKFYSRQK